MGNQDMDVHSSAAWAGVINSELKSRIAWKAKYGHQYPDISRCSTSMSQNADQNQETSKEPSRPGTQMSQQSAASAGTVQKRKELQALKKKLMSALEEVDSELADTN